MVWKDKPLEDKEKKTTLFGKVVAQKIVQPRDLLKFDDVFYKSKIKPELDKLGMNATEMQKIETIFDLIKAKGKLGIEYESFKRIPKTPDEVLKDKKADCDEFSLTFLAAAEKAGIPIEKFNLLVITFEVETDFGAEKESRHAAVLNLKSESDKTFLLDFAISEVGIVKLKEMNKKSLNNVYLNREVIGGKIIGVKSYSIKQGKNKILSTYYEERANYYDIEKKEYIAISYYEKAKELNSDNEPIITKLTDLYLHVALNREKDDKVKERYLRRAVELSPEKLETNFRLGKFLGEHGQYKEALSFLKKAVVLGSSHIQSRYGLAFCFDSLGLNTEAEKGYLETIEISNKALKTNPSNTNALEFLCRANLNLTVMYHAEGNTEKAKKYNLNALNYAGQGQKLSKRNTKEYKFFLKIKKKTELNSKLFH